MDQILSLNSSGLVTAERLRAGLQFNKTLALGVKGLKPQVGSGVVGYEPLVLIQYGSLGLFIMCLKMKSKTGSKAAL